MGGGSGDSTAKRRPGAGIIPPGMDVGANGVEKPHYPRLYTVATSRYGSQLPASRSPSPHC